MAYDCAVVPAGIRRRIADRDDAVRHSFPLHARGVSSAPSPWSIPCLAVTLPAHFGQGGIGAKNGPRRSEGKLHGAVKFQAGPFGMGPFLAGYFDTNMAIGAGARID